jgi:hypothetical protein
LGYASNRSRLRVKCFLQRAPLGFFAVRPNLSGAGLWTPRSEEEKNGS